MREWNGKTYWLIGASGSHSFASPPATPDTLRSSPCSTRRSMDRRRRHATATFGTSWNINYREYRRKFKSEYTPIQNILSGGSQESLSAWNDCCPDSLSKSSAGDLFLCQCWCIILVIFGAG